MFELLPFDRRERNLANYFDTLERSFFGSLPNIGGLRTDVLDKGDHYLLQAELPGFAKEDISLKLKGNELTISAQHKEEKEEKDEKTNYVCQERHYGSFVRTFNTNGIQTDQISARYADGVLELTMPKKEAERTADARQIEIE